MSTEHALRVFFSRLTWPSPLVRERAAVELARLLADPAVGEAVRTSYLGWLASLPYESLCGAALLPPLRAAAVEGRAVISASDLREAVPHPSLQSALLLRAYPGGSERKADPARIHTGTVPDDFAPDPFFSRYVTAYLPPAYDARAGRLEAAGCVGFRRQWAYEWEAVCRRTGVALSTRPLEYWIGGRRDDERHLGADMPLSEVYRSAYLRALAWAVDCREVPLEVAELLAGAALPVDLDRWLVPPGRRPGWWPGVSDDSGVLETGPAEVWAALAALWDRQQRGEAPWGPDWCLAAASGHLHRGRTTYDLSLASYLHKRFDAGEPDLAAVAGWYADLPAAEVRGGDGPLRFRGAIEPGRPHGFTEDFGGVSFLPVACGVWRAGPVLRWQWWRDFRGVSGPAPYLSPAGYEVGCDERGIAYCVGGEEVARWGDWTEALRERLADGVNPATGQFLLVRRSLVDRVAEATGARLCWVAQVKGSYQEHGYGEYSHFRTERAYGLSDIIH